MTQLEVETCPTSMTLSLELLDGAILVWFTGQTEFLSSVEVLVYYSSSLSKFLKYGSF